MRLQRAEICAVAGRSLFRGDGGRATISAWVCSLGAPGLSTLAALLMLCYTQVSVRGSASPIRCGRCALPLDVTPRGMAAVQAPRIRLPLALALLQVRCCLIAQLLGPVASAGDVSSLSSAPLVSAAPHAGLAL